MATIIISPYSAKMRNGKENPKNYPHWPEVVKMLKDEGHYLIQIGVEGEEKLEGVDEVKFNLPLAELRDAVEAADTWISVDNFLHHMCALFKKCGIAIWGKSDPAIFGHHMHINLLKDRKNLRVNQYDIWEAEECNPDVFVPAIEVVEAVKSLLGG